MQKHWTGLAITGSVGYDSCMVPLGDASCLGNCVIKSWHINRTSNFINAREQFAHFISYNTASTQVNILKVHPLKQTECELTASSERLTSVTFLTSYYWGYPAAMLPLGHWSYAHTITNSHTCIQTHTDIKPKERIKTHERCTQKLGKGDCHLPAWHSCFSVTEGAAVRRELWVAAGRGKEMRRVDRG